MEDIFCRGDSSYTVCLMDLCPSRHIACCRTYFLQAGGALDKTLSAQVLVAKASAPTRDRHDAIRDTS